MTVTREPITARQAAIERVCARYELESDEFLTREQKAEAYLMPAAPYPGG